MAGCRAGGELTLKTTIADWERGDRAISKEHDYELRGIALAVLIDRLSPKERRHLGERGGGMAQILLAPRTAAPPKRPKPYVIRAITPLSSLKL